MHLYYIYNVNALLTNKLIYVREKQNHEVKIKLTSKLENR